MRAPIYFYQTAVATLVACAALTVVACSSAPQHSPSARQQVLQTQVDDLNRQLTLLQNASGDDQEALMRGYWDMLQKQLNYVRNLPDVAPRGCNDWTVMDPHVTGHAGFWNSRPCPTLHDEGPAAGWGFPDKLTPHLFTLTMKEQLDVLTAQVTEIGVETDATSRLDLLRQHYETRYRDIQTVLGRGWMWTPQDPARLPQAGSMGAQTFGHYCSQCHAAPPPTLRTRAEWVGILNRMHGILERQSQIDVAGGVHMPTPDEFQLISSYLESNAAE